MRRTGPTDRSYELRVRGQGAGYAVRGNTAERAARAWAAAHGLPEDARDDDGRIRTFMSVGNDVRREDSA